MQSDTNDEPTDPHARPQFRPPAGLTRYARLARYWTTIAWNIAGPNRSRSIFVLGYPRTGTNWLSRILSYYFDMPRFVPKEHRLPVLSPQVLHLHRFAVVPARTIYTVRDPRDIAVSYYHKVVNTGRSALRTRIAGHLRMPYEHENVRENLPDFIRLSHEEDIAGSIPLAEHLEKARKLDLFTVRYEDLLQDGEATIAGAVAHLTGAPADPERVRFALAETSFEKKTGRKRGEQDLRWASLRKGIAGDWKNHFTREAAQLFQEIEGETLVALGYERDDRWVDDVPSAAGPA